MLIEILFRNFSRKFMWGKLRNINVRKVLEIIKILVMECGKRRRGGIASPQYYIYMYLVIIYSVLYWGTIRDLVI